MRAGEAIETFLHVETPLRVVSGPDSLGQLGRELDRVKVGRAVILCGRTLARDGSPLDLVRAALGDRCAGVIPAARPHSPIPAVLGAAEDLRRLGADAVIAVGGGSAIVTARAASILLAEGADIDRLATSIGPDGRLTSPKLAAPKLPRIVVPTTPTTATVKAGSAVYDPVGARRRALFDPKTRAQAVFVHPDLLRPVPVAAFVSAGLNTLAMAVEGLISRTGDPMADALLMHALRLSVANIARPDLAGNDAARSALMTAALLCGRGTDHTSGGMTSALGHAIGAREVGQPARVVATAQTGGGVEELRLIAELLGEIGWDEPAGSARVRRVAAGVVGAITAWNGPLRSVISKAGAAMAAGCAVVLKGSAPGCATTSASGRRKARAC